MPNFKPLPRAHESQQTALVMIRSVRLTRRFPLAYELHIQPSLGFLYLRLAAI
jgi:hypothetical protein